MPGRLAGSGVHILSIVVAALLLMTIVLGIPLKMMLYISKIYHSGLELVDRDDGSPGGGHKFRVPEEHYAQIIDQADAEHESRTGSVQSADNDLEEESVFVDKVSSDSVESEHTAARTGAVRTVTPHDTTPKQHKSKLRKSISRAKVWKMHS